MERIYVKNQGSNCSERFSIPGTVYLQVLYHCVFAILFGFALPTVVAKFSGVLFDDDIKQLMILKGNEYKTKIEQSQKRQELERNIVATDNLLVLTAPDRRTDLLDKKAAYERELATLSFPVSIQAYNGHIVMYFWPVMYLCLGCMAFLIPPKSNYEPASLLFTRSTAVMALCIYAMLIWPLWYRNIALAGPASNRKLYAYPNIDISPYCFVMQNLNYLGFAVLLAHLETMVVVLRRA